MTIRTRRLLRLYPRAWRERYGQELVALTGPVVGGKSAMNIIASAVRQRFTADGWSVAYAKLAAKLSIAFLCLMATIAAHSAADFVSRFPGRAVSWPVVRSWLLPPGTGLFALMWLVFAVVATLLALLVHRFGWRARRPRLSALVVRAGVCVGMAVAYAVTIPPIGQLSDHSLLVIGWVLGSSLLAGVVVESADIGRSPRRIAS